MTILDGFLTVSVSQLVGTTKLPDTPWIRLWDVESFVVGINSFTNDDDWPNLLSDWICAAGFSGVRFIGRPATAHTDEAIGPMQEIPSVYFRKQRGCYGHGLSRVSMNQTSDEMNNADRDDERGIGEPDWIEVLVSRDDLVSYVRSTGQPVEKMLSGAPGRPSSMQLVHLEFERRVKSNSLSAKMKDEAGYLEAWLRKNYPMQPRLTAKTISNNLNADFRRARETLSRSHA